MSAYKVVRDSAGRCRGCGPNDANYQPEVPAGGTIELSDVFVPVEATPQEQVIAARIAADEQERVDCKLDATIMNLVDQTRAQWRTWAGNNFPTLSAAERTRLGDLFWVVAVGVRRTVRNGG
jgi:hypothetical protein